MPRKVIVCPECGEPRTEKGGKCSNCPSVNKAIEVTIGVARIMKEFYINYQRERIKRDKERKDYIDKYGLEEYDRYIKEKSDTLFK